MADDRNVVRLPTSESKAPVSEDSIACLAAKEHEGEVAWCPERGSWLVWTGTRWRNDSTGEVFERVRNVCRAMSIALTAEKWGKFAAVSAVEKFMRTHPSMVVPAAKWNADPMLIGTPSGMVDLSTGETLPPDRSKYISRCVSIDPSVDPPVQWLAFLDDACGGDAEMVRYLQRLAGYALTGHVAEHSVYFVYGPGGNGKSVFINALSRIMDEYAVQAPIDTFMAGDRHSTELAMLQGARLVTASETEEGRSWAEAKLKALTGGDPITARFMRRDFFTYRPQFSLVIIGNHRPELASVTVATRRRLRIIPFVNQPEAPDPDLPDKLADEFPSILRWMIEGCLDFYAEDMTLPPVIASETELYFEEQDSVATWILECCERDFPGTPSPAQRRTIASKLFRSWTTWCSDNGEKPGNMKTFSERMRRYGFIKRRTEFGIEYGGIGIKHREGPDRGLNL